MRLVSKLLPAAAALALVSATAPRPVTAAPVPAVSTLSIATPTAAFAPALHTMLLVQDAKIDVDVDSHDGGAWYTQPVWIAIGIIALVLIILLITAAGRRGGSNTTVVK
jgi:hypothetical protein